MADPIHVALGMLGTDVHSKGLRTLASLLEDEGFRVSYIGEHLAPAHLAKGAKDVSAEIVGVSYSSAAYIDYTRQLVDALREEGASDTAVMVGGLVHADHYEELQNIGVAGIFGPGSAMDEIYRFVEATGQAVRRKRIGNAVAEVGQ